MTPPQPPNSILRNASDDDEEEAGAAVDVDVAAVAVVSSGKHDSRNPTVPN